MRSVCRVAALFGLGVLHACGGGTGGGEMPATPVPDSLSVSSAATAEAGVAQVFTSSATAAAGLRFDWTFGDGTASTEAGPAHAYVNGSDYVITLRISNSAGQAREATARVTVNRVAHLQGLRCNGTNQRGWCRLDPPNTGSGAFDIQFVDADNGWAVGGFGAILRTRDGGRTWTAQESGVAAALGAVRFRSASEGYAFGADRLLLRTADGGSTWEALVGPQPARQEGSFVGSAFLDLFGPTGIVVYGTEGFTPRSSSSFMFTSNDRGTTWNRYAFHHWQASPGGVVRGLPRGRFGASGIGSNPLFRSTDMGASFQPVISFQQSADTPFSRMATDLVVFNDLSVLVRWAPWTYADPELRPAINMLTRDGGQSWTTFLPSGVPAAAQGYLLGHDSTGWILSDSTQGCRASNDFGRTWNIPVATPDGGCAIYRNGMLIAERWLSLDRGTSWRAFTPPADLRSSGTKTCAASAPTRWCSAAGFCATWA